MAVSVEVVYQNKAWNLERANFAFADDWLAARKAVRELNERVLSRDNAGPLIKKDLSRKPKMTGNKKGEFTAIPFLPSAAEIDKRRMEHRPVALLVA